jgi:predicted metal-binding membrane protein
MGHETGAMGLALPLFTALWITMMAAMMIPSVAPTAIMWTRAIAAKASGGQRALRITEFVSGYLLAWAAYGLLAYAALTAIEQMVEVSPETGRLLGVGLFAAAGIYQFTPLKDVCLRHCRSPLGQLLHYGSFGGPARDLRVGLHHGFFCVGCCWALMVVLLAMGVMNLAAMIGLAFVIALEKLWRRGETFARVVGVIWLLTALAAYWFPSIAPGLRAGSMDM